MIFFTQTSACVVVGDRGCFVESSNRELKIQTFSGRRRRGERVRLGRD